MSLAVTSAPTLRPAAGRRRTVPRTGAPTAPVRPPTVPAIPLLLPEHELEGIGQEQRSGLAVAQTAWLRRTQTLDERIPRYSRQVSFEELEFALRVLRSLFRLDQTPDLTFRAALCWGSLLLTHHEHASHQRRTPALALPYLWLSPQELPDEGDLDALLTLPTPKPERTRRSRVKREVPDGASTRTSAATAAPTSTETPRTSAARAAEASPTPRQRGGRRARAQVSAAEANTTSGATAAGLGGRRSRRSESQPARVRRPSA